MKFRLGKNKFQRKGPKWHRSFLRVRVFMVIFFVSVFALQSCSSGNDAEKIITTNKDTLLPLENFAKGQIIDKVALKNDASQSYALYLPGNYSLEKKYSIIYAFDPHSDGRLPVNKYKELAEQYNYIIVGSNNSKNGTSWEESQIIANNLFADAGNRLSINTQRIYVLGFSGGARIANALAITNGSIAGAVCCGAAAPAANSNIPRSNYSFLGIVGSEDFNYTEMRKYEMSALAGHNVKHALITFDGKHEWPAKEIMDEAFWWLELNEMRKNNATKNDSLISKHIQPALKQIELLLKKKQVFEAFKLCQKTITFYDGLTDLTFFYSTYKSLQSNPEIDKQLKLEEASWMEEDKLKQEYINAMQKQNLIWWEKNIATLNQKIKSGKNKNKVLMNKRVLGFLSLAAYMQTTGALKQNVLPAADFFARIYILVDPTNNEAHYLMAEILAKNGKAKEAVKSISSAVQFGFKDIERAKNDSAFIEIKNTVEWGNVISGIK